MQLMIIMQFILGMFLINICKLFLKNSILEFNIKKMYFNYFKIESLKNKDLTVTVDLCAPLGRLIDKYAVKI